MAVEFARLPLAANDSCTSRFREAGVFSFFGTSRECHLETTQKLLLREHQNDIESVELRGRINSPGGGASHSAKGGSFADLHSALDRLLRLALSRGETKPADDVRALLARFAEGRFYVACVGQFKRGKSTLIDALIGGPILPTGITPVTAIPTIIRFGHERHARVKRAESDWQVISLDAIADFVSERSNPGNLKRVEGVEVLVPADVLSDGLCLIDTPGLGSVYEWNAETTRELIPEIDVGVVVTGAEPPITADELKIIEALLTRTSTIFLVMNKADLSSAEAVEEAAQFAQSIIVERTGFHIEGVFLTNAKAHLNGVDFDDDWQALRTRLASVSESSRRDLVRSGVSHGVRRIASRLAWSVEEEATMLANPISDAKVRIERLEQLSLDLDRSIGDLHQLVRGEQLRIAAAVDTDAARFLDSTLKRAHQSLIAAAEEIETRGAGLRRDLTLTAQRIADQHLSSWLKSEAPRIDQLYGECIQRFVDSARTFLERAAADAEIPFASAELLTVPPSLPPKTEYYFGRFENIAMSASPLRVVADLVRGAFGARREIVNDAEHYLTRLLESNASRIQFDFRVRLDGARAHFERNLAIFLGEMLASAKNNLRRVRDTHDKGVAAVQDRLRSLDRERSELRCVHDSASGFGLSHAGQLESQ